MREIRDSEDLKEVQLNILSYFHEICMKNNLGYYLCGGTLLGAVRHKGFIPWDDDIDLAMYRSDYEKLLEVWNSEKYRILKPGDEGYYYCFPKIVDNDTYLDEYEYKKIKNMGVFIDVFIIEKVGRTYGDAEEVFVALTKIRKLITAFSYVFSNKKMFEGMKVFVKYFPISKKKLIRAQRRYIDIAKRNDKTDAKYVYITGGAYSEKDILPRRFFRETEDFEFEGKYFKATANYHDYLTTVYGDYRILPPVESQVTHHNFKAYWKNDEE